MVQRITSGRIGQGPSPFDPMAIARAGQAAAQSFEPVVQAVDAAARKIDAYEEKQSDLNMRIESARVDREVAADLSKISSDSTLVPESGAGYSNAAMSAWEARRDEALARAGTDLRKKRKLDEYFRLDRENQLQVFQKQEREFSRKYSLDQHIQSLDDFRQQVSRQQYAQPGATGIKASLGFTESGGNYGARNSEGFVGKYQFGQARLNEFFAATGRAPVSMEQFRNSPQIQEAAMDWHVADINQFIRTNGLDRFEGRVVDGVAITRNGMIAMAHLGGKGGMQRFLESGGSYNPADSNGTSLSDYARTHGVDANGIPNYNGPLPKLGSDPVYADARSTLYGQIDAMNITEGDRAALRREVDSALTLSAIGSIGEQNPSVALAMLRSGEYDAQLTYDQDQSAQRSLTKELEGQIAAQAKKREAALKDEANRAADDYLAATENGIEGQARPTAEQYSMLTDEMRQRVDRAPTIGAARVFVESAPVEQIPAYLAALQEPGDNMAARQSAFEAVKSRADARYVKAGADREIAQAGRASRPVNTAVPGVKDALDGRWQDVVDRAAQDGTSPLEVLNGFVDQYGALPSSVSQALALSISSDDPVVVAQAASAISIINRDHPDALAGVNQSLRDMAFGIQSRMGRGISASEARQAAIRATESGSRDIIKRLAGDNDHILDLVRSAVDDDWFGAPEMTAETTAALVQTFEDALLRTQDLETAKMSVRADWRENFSPSSLTSSGGGKVWTQGAPEKAYGVWGDPDKDAVWIEEQLKEEVGEDWKDVFLTPRPAILGEPQSYDVMGVNEDGLIANLSIERGPWAPDPSAEIAARDIRDEASQKVERARELDAMIKQGEGYVYRQEAFRKNGGALADDAATFAARAALLDELKSERAGIDLESEKRQIRDAGRRGIAGPIDPARGPYVTNKEGSN